MADPRVAEYLNENFVSTYLKVGTFQIINGQKVGGNVASYFCLYDGSVMHAVPGQTNADKLLTEARWAYETRKAAATLGTNLRFGTVDTKKYAGVVRRAHHERCLAEQGITGTGKYLSPLPARMPRHRSQAEQAHWLLARNPLVKLDVLYPVVWTQVLNEQLSGLPVAKQ